MSGLSGVPPFTVSVNLSSSSPATFRVGQVLDGIVQSTGKELLLLVGGRQVALPPGTPLSNGQAVSAEVLRTEPGLQLRIAGAGQQANAGGAGPGVPLAIAGGQSAAVLTAGLPAVLEGTIRQTAQGFVFQSGQTAIRLASVPENLVGAAVWARVAETDQGPRLVVWPNAEAVGAPAGGGHDVRAVLARVFQALGQPGLAERAASLTPRSLPPADASVRLVASLFLERGADTALIDRLVSIVRQGVAAGAASSEQERTLVSLLARAAGGDTKELQAALRVAAQVASRTPEAAIARALAQSAGAAGVAEDLRTVLHQLRNSEPFRAFLEQSGQHREFTTAASNVMDRVSASQLQNLRGFETSYLYFEPAFLPGSGLNRAHIHVFGDGGGRQSFAADNSTVVLDLSTTRLGDLWITLSAVHGVCTCVFRASAAPIADLIGAHARELEQILSESAGYTHAQVKAVIWDGDRFGAAVELFRPLQGLDTEA